jgi:hypothetical protein
LAVGTAEAFTLVDFLTLDFVIREVRSFHEVQNEPMPPLPLIMSVVSFLLRSVFAPGLLFP